MSFRSHALGYCRHTKTIATTNHRYTLIALYATLIVAASQQCEFSSYFSCVSSNSAECESSCNLDELQLIGAPGDCTQNETFCNLASCCPSCAASIIEYKDCLLGPICGEAGCAGIAPSEPSPSIMIPSIVSPSGIYIFSQFPIVYKSCESLVIEWTDCGFQNFEECQIQCADSTLELPLSLDCKDFESSCNGLTCCSQCEEQGRAVGRCGFVTCSTVECPATAPFVRLPTPTTAPFPLVPTMMSFNPTLDVPSPSITWPPVNLWLAAVQTCEQEVFTWYSCLTTNSASCENECVDLTPANSSVVSGCDDVQSLCNSLTCCDSCSNKGREFGACLSSFYQCDTDCGSHTPVAPTTVDFPSIAGSIMPVMLPLLSGYPLGDGDGDGDDNDSSSPVSPESPGDAPTTETNPISPTAPAAPAAPVESSNPVASETNETAPTAESDNGTDAPSPSSGCSFMDSSTWLFSFWIGFMVTLRHSIFG